MYLYILRTLDRIQESECACVVTCKCDSCEKKLPFDAPVWLAKSTPFEDSMVSSS